MTYVNILTLLCCHLPFHYGPHINSSIPSFVTLANNTDSQEINCVWKNQTSYHDMKIPTASNFKYTKINLYIQ